MRARKSPLWVIFNGNARRRKPVHVRSAPIAKEFCALQRMAVSAMSGREQLQQNGRLFDHLVGLGQQCW
jgi:hypothetical protein